MKIFSEMLTDHDTRSTKDPGQKPFTYHAGVQQVIVGWDQVCFHSRPSRVCLVSVSVSVCLCLCVYEAYVA